MHDDRMAVRGRAHVVSKHVLLVLKLGIVLEVGGVAMFHGRLVGRGCLLGIAAGGRGSRGHVDSRWAVLFLQVLRALADSPTCSALCISLYLSI